MLIKQSIQFDFHHIQCEGKNCEWTYYIMQRWKNYYLRVDISRVLSNLLKLLP